MKACLLATMMLAATITFAQGKSDEQALLGLHARARQAHLTGDADMLAEGLAPQHLDVGRGKFESVTREAFRERFKKVFATTKYSRWDDAVPPFVHIAPGGKSGWMAVQLIATVTSRAEGKPPETTDFQMAWLANYEKQNCKWVMVAISYNVPPGK